MIRVVSDAENKKKKLQRELDKAKTVINSKAGGNKPAFANAPKVIRPMDSYGDATSFAEYSAMRKKQEQDEANQGAAELLAQRYRTPGTIGSKEYQEANAGNIGYKRVGNKVVFVTPGMPLPNPTKENTVARAQAPGAAGFDPEEYLVGMRAFDEYTRKTTPKDTTTAFMQKYFGGLGIDALTEESIEAKWAELPESERTDFLWAAKDPLADVENIRKIQGDYDALKNTEDTENPVYDDETQTLLDRYFGGKVPTADQYSEVYDKVLNDPSVSDEDVRYLYERGAKLIGNAMNKQEAEEREYSDTALNYYNAEKLLGADAKQYAGGTDAEYYERFDNTYGAKKAAEGPYLTYGGAEGMSLEEAKKYSASPYIGKGQGYDLQRWSQATPEERERYNKLLSNYGQEVADNYMKALEGQLNRRLAEAETQNAQQYAEEHPVLSNLRTFVTAPIRGAGVLERYLEEMQGRQPDEYDPRLNLIRESEAIRGQTAKSIQENVDGWAGDALAFAYQTGTSIGDNLANMALWGGLGNAATLISMGLTSAGSAYNSAIDRGATHEQANAAGMISGLAEAFFERFSLDNIITLAKGGGLKNVLINVGKQMGIEGSEEFATAVANEITDRAVMGELSQFELNKQRFMNDGMTEAEAHMAAYAEAAKEIGLSMAAGALSGGVMGAGAQAISSYGKYAEKKAQEAEHNKQNAPAEEGAQEQQPQQPEQQEKPVQQTNQPEEEQLPEDYAEAAKTWEPEPTEGDAKNAEQENTATESTQHEQALQQQPSEQKGEQEQGEKEKPSKAPEKAKKGASFKTPMQANEYDSEGASHALQIVGVNSVTDDGRVIVEAQNEKGETELISADALEFEDPTTTMLLDYGPVRRMDAAAVRNYLESYVPEMASEEGYGQAYSAVYQRGAAGVDYNEAVRGLESFLSPEAAFLAYAAGENAYNQKHDTVQAAEIVQEPAAEETSGVKLSAKEPQGKGKLSKRYTMKAFSRLSMEAKRRANAQMEILAALASRTKRTIQVVDTIVTEDGEHANALYDPKTGVIKVALDADEGAYAYAAAHELVHALKNEHKGEWGAFRDFVLEALNESDEDVEALIKHQMDRLGYNRADALEEVICNTVPAILQDENNLFKLYKGNRTLFERVMNWVKGLLDDVKSVGQNLSKRSQSWKQMDALGKNREAMQQIYDRMMAVMERGAEDVSDTNVVKMSAKESTNDQEIAHVKDQLIANRDAVNRLPVVAAVWTKGRTGRSDAQLTKEVLESYKASGYEVDRQGFGVVDFGEKAIDKAVHYANSDAEYAAILAAKKVVKRGIEIHSHADHKERRYSSTTFAGPVEVNGKKGIEAVLVKKTKGNRFTVARILAPDGSAFVFENKKDAEPTTGGGRPATEAAAVYTPISPASANSISNTEEKVKLSKKESAEYEQLLAEHRAASQELREIQEKLESATRSDEYNNLVDKVVHGSTEEQTQALIGLKAFEEKHSIAQLSERKKVLGKQVNELARMAEEARKNKVKAEEAKALEKSGLSREEHKRKQAVKEFGYTPYFYDAGYLLPNGKMLNFSGEKGKHFGMRGQDHRAIMTIYDDADSQTAAMVAFMNDGNIRVMAETPGVDISNLVEPSKDQYAALRQMVREYQGEEYFSVDISDENGRNAGSLVYEGKVYPDKVISDIQHYFQTGEFREQSEMSRFRYSLRDTDENVQNALTAQQAAFQQIQGGHNITALEADKVAGTMLKAANSDYDQKQLAGELSRIFHYIETAGEDVDWQQVDDEMTELSARVMARSRTIDLEHEQEAKPVRDYLRKTAIAFTKDQKDEAALISGSYAAYRKAMFGRVRLSNTAGSSLEHVWRDLHDMAPQWFDEDTKAGDMPRALMEAVDAMKTVYHNGSGMNVEESAQWLAGVMTDVYFQLPAVQAAVKDARKFGDSIRELNKAWQTFKDTSWSGYQNALEAIKAARGKQQRTEQQERVAAMRKKYATWRESDNALRRERETKTKYRSRIERTTSTLLNWLDKPTDAKHIPSNVEGYVRNLLASLDFTGKNTRTASELSQRLNMLADALRSAQEGEDESRTVFLERDQQMIDEIKHLAEVIAGNQQVGRSVYDLNGLELKELSKWLDVVKHVITEANKMHGGNMNVDEAAQATISELSGKKDFQNKNPVLKKLYGVLGPDMMDSFTFFEQLGSTANYVFSELRKGFDKMVQMTRTAEEHTKSILKGLNMKELSGRKAPKLAFELAKGGTLELTKAQIMEIYVLSRREQAQGHLYGDGVIVGKGEDVKAKPLTPGDVKRMTDSLTDAEKKAAELMQRFLSRECAAWGNEASLTLLGYRKFGEEYYWPISTDANARNTTKLEDNYAADIGAIKNQGMTKQTIEGAKNAIVINDIFHTYTRHISNMSAYAAYAVPLSDFTRWMNSRGVKTEIQQKYGKKALEYMNEFLMAINGTSRQAPTSGLVQGVKVLNRNAKAASVGLNARVVIQQPTSFARAGMYMSPKYLSKALGMKAPRIELVNKYCGIAQWKNWGFYETNIGPSLRAMVVGDQTAIENLREKGMWLAAKGDEWTMKRIWNACEAETQEIWPELKVGSEEYYRQVGQRMSEIVDRTQVVDSVFHRSQMMRSKNELNQMLTNFMSEPTKTYNMLMGAIAAYAENRKDKAARNRVARALVTYAVSGVLTAAAAALVDALRDDDAEKEWVEKYLDALGENTMDNLNPLGMIPMVKDVLSLLEGYEASRLDQQSIQRIVWAAQEIEKYQAGTSKMNLYGVSYKTMQSVSSVLGIPVSNLMREGNAIYQSITKVNPTKTAAAQKSSTITTLYKAMLEGKVQRANELRTRLQKDAGMTPKEIDTAIAEELKGHEKVKEAYEAKASGRIADANRARNELTSKGFSAETVDKAIARYESGITPKETKEKDPNEELNVKMYDTNDAANTIRMACGLAKGSSSIADAKAVISELIADSTAKDPEKTTKSNVQSALKAEYIALIKEGKTAQAQALARTMQELLGTSQSTLDKWAKEARTK